MTPIPLPPLTAHRYQFELTLHQNAHLPTYLGAMLRGGFGLTFKRFVCMQPQLEQCDGCLLLHTCAYPAVFQPVPPPNATVLSTHDRIPVPYILEPPPPRAAMWEKGETIPFGLTLFGHSQAYLPYFVLSFQQVARQGLGQQRTRATLSHVYAISPDDETSLWEEGALRLDWAQFGHWPTPTLPPATSPYPMGVLSFHTPARLKYKQNFVQEPPPFHVIFRTLLRRVSSLSYFYANHHWDIDYRDWIEQAKQVQTISTTAHWQDWQRYSTRQQRHMNLGGITGSITYQANDLTPFLPLLILGQLTHVGKGTSFGNGRYQLHLP